MKTLLETVHNKALFLWKKENLLNESITISAAPLTVKEAIGTPDSTDFPIQQGKEKLMEALFRGEKGQAFTNTYGNYTGSLRAVSELPLNNNFNRAIFISTLNAVSRSLNMSDHTIHCRNDGPKKCSKLVFETIRRQFGRCRITLIGFQPALAEALNAKTDIRLIDLDPENIGQRKRGVLVEGRDSTADAIDWCDVLLVTGTTLANGTIDMFMTEKPVMFYGTTISGGAALMGWNRFCPQSA